MTLPERAATAPIDDDAVFLQGPIALRLVRLEDCTERYVAWLEDPEVSRYLETRWSRQTLPEVREFITSVRASLHSHLFAIWRRDTGEHIGNIKIGPINPMHRYADVSYFIGERSAWGRGYATAAIRCATRIGFAILGLHRVRAGVYEGNVASARALERVGYTLDGTLRRQMRCEDRWEDLLCYGILAEEFDADEQ